MTISYRSNLVAGVVGIVFGVVLWFLVPVYVGEEYAAFEGVDSRTLPYAISVVCALFGAGLVFQSLVLKRDKVRKMELGREAKAVFYMLMFIVYGYVFTRDFIVATTFLGWVTLLFTGSKKTLYYAIVLTMTIVMYLLFIHVLRVRLPSEWLGAFIPSLAA